jgi:hypothetical protein
MVYSSVCFGAQTEPRSANFDASEIDKLAVLRAVNIFRERVTFCLRKMRSQGILILSVLN